MQVLVLNASPRKEGTVAGLLRAFCAGLDPAHRVEWVDVHYLAMRPCNACMGCRPDGPCVLPRDDAHRVGEAIALADALVIGTPTHWANLASQLKVLLDRNVPVFMGEGPRGLPAPRHKGKPAVIVTACTTPWPFNVLAGQSRGAMRAVWEPLKQGGYRLRGKLVKAGTKGGPRLSERDKARARRLAARL